MRSAPVLRRLEVDRRLVFEPDLTDCGGAFTGDTEGHEEVVGAFDHDGFYGSGVGGYMFVGYFVDQFVVDLVDGALEDLWVVDTKCFHDTSEDIGASGLVFVGEGGIETKGVDEAIAEGIGGVDIFGCKLATAIWVGDANAGMGVEGGPFMPEVDFDVGFEPIAADFICFSEGPVDVVVFCGSVHEAEGLHGVEEG